MVVATALVATLTAEVRVLMVGARQITLSVFRQLDKVEYHKCEPMGRVNEENDLAWIVGRHRETGDLVRASLHHHAVKMRWWVFSNAQEQELDRLSKIPGTHNQKRIDELLDERRRYLECREEMEQAAREYAALPLIVLAGLK